MEYIGYVCNGKVLWGLGTFGAHQGRARRLHSNQGVSLPGGSTCWHASPATPSQQLMSPGSINRSLVATRWWAVAKHLEKSSRLRSNHGQVAQPRPHHLQGQAVGITLLASGASKEQVQECLS